MMLADPIGCPCAAVRPLGEFFCDIKDPFFVVLD